MLYIISFYFKLQTKLSVVVCKDKQSFMQVHVAEFTTFFLRILVLLVNLDHILKLQNHKS